MSHNLCYLKQCHLLFQTIPIFLNVQKQITSNSGRLLDWAYEEKVDPQKPTSMDMSYAILNDSIRGRQEGLYNHMAILNCMEKLDYVIGVVNDSAKKLGARSVLAKVSINY
jgi:hypothetical protein